MEKRTEAAEATACLRCACAYLSWHWADMALSCEYCTNWTPLQARPTACVHVTTSNTVCCAARCLHGMLHSVHVHVAPDMCSSHNVLYSKYISHAAVVQCLSTGWPVISERSLQSKWRWRLFCWLWTVSSTSCCWVSDTCNTCPYTAVSSYVYQSHIVPTVHVVLYVHVLDG